MTVPHISDCSRRWCSAIICLLLWPLRHEVTCSTWFSSPVVHTPAIRSENLQQASFVFVQAQVDEQLAGKTAEVQTLQEENAVLQAQVIDLQQQLSVAKNRLRSQSMQGIPPWHQQRDQASIQLLSAHLNYFVDLLSSHLCTDWLSAEFITAFAAAGCVQESSHALLTMLACLVQVCSQLLVTGAKACQAMKLTTKALEVVWLESELARLLQAVDKPGFTNV